MSERLYSARTGDSHSIAEAVSYDVLVARIMEFTVRAALARSIDETDWEQEELRRKGLTAIEIFRGGKAVWADRTSYETELAEACREHVKLRFENANEADPAFYARLDRDLRSRWRLLGYESPSLRNDMKALFGELEREIGERAARARESLVTEIIGKES